MIRKVLPLVFASTVAGCASVASTPHPQHINLGEIQMLSTTASVSSLIITPGGSQKFCTQPSPDATFNESEGFSFSLVTIPGKDESSSQKDSSVADEMQGRVPAVLMARELFYRLCELSLNNPGQLDKILPLYEKTLDIIEAGWMKESSQYTIQESLTTTETITNSGLAETEIPPSTSVSE